MPINAKIIIISAISTAAMSLIATTIAGESPADFEKFTRAAIGHPMSVETREYNFSLSEENEDFYIIEGSSESGDTIRHAINDPSFYNAERMFALESHGCGGTSIDLIIQTGPSKNSDILRRNYYRIVFSRDLTTVISEFYDPSVYASNAVLPIQSVEGITDPETKSMITCDGTTPVITGN